MVKTYSGAASVWIGWDPREFAAYTVARSTMRRAFNLPIPIHGLILDEVTRQGLYHRPIEYRPTPMGRAQMFDTISGAPMSTHHACARFLVPHLAKRGWAMFVDGDVMVRKNISNIFDGLDPLKALYCVKHKFEPEETMKMDGQIQTQYLRKNWSSVMIFNCSHPANRALSIELVNELPGRDLHRFCWLNDDEIGELPQEYNYLVGHTRDCPDPAIVHFTSGTPDMPGYEFCEYSDEWRTELMRHVA